MTHRVEHLSEDVTLYQGDCNDLISVVGPVDVVITDPPYGCKKADWDDVFPCAWYGLVEARSVVIVTGSAGLKDSLALVGDDFIDCIAARNMNGMTRGPLGFGNWLAAVVAKGKPKQGINAFDFNVSAEMPDHPSPKPVSYMLKLVDRVTVPGDLVLDCFMGSGTTGLACARLGRGFVGIEQDEKHFDLSCRRIADELRRPRLFAEPVRAPRQEALL